MKHFKSVLVSPLGNEYPFEQFVSLDLSIKKVSRELGKNGLSNYINNVKEKAQAQVAYGGYLEKRNLYVASNHFGINDRNIHLGIDYWMEAGTNVFAPLDGIIHSFAYNDQVLDYGYTIILQHELDGDCLYTLYGHLSSKHFSTWKVGHEVKAGEAIAEIGPIHENGGWLPHLHFQLIKDMGDWQGDFPGVCTADDLGYYEECCPNPLSLFQ